MFRTGQLRHRITILEYSSEPDGKGGVTSTWAQVATVWALIVPTGGAEAVTGGTIQSQVRYRIIVRDNAQIHPRQRIEWRSKVMDIRAVQPVEPGFLQLEAEEISDAGGMLPPEGS